MNLCLVIDCELQTYSLRKNLLHEFSKSLLSTGGLLKIKQNSSHLITAVTFGHKTLQVHYKVDIPLIATYFPKGSFQQRPNEFFQQMASHCCDS